MQVNFIFQTNFHCFFFQLNSDEFLNVDLLLEEAMHALVIGPLTSRLRDSLRQNLMEKKSNPSQEPLTSNSDDNSEIMKNEVAFVTQQTLNAFKDCFIQMKNSVSPLDKLAHMLTGLKVITNAVSFVYYIYVFELLTTWFHEVQIFKSSKRTNQNEPYFLCVSDLISLTICENLKFDNL